MFATVFFLFESTMLDIILRFFIRDINDYEIRKKITRNMTVINRFFISFTILLKKQNALV